MDLYTLLKRTDSYITNWEACMAPSLTPFPFTIWIRHGLFIGRPLESLVWREMENCCAVSLIANGKQAYEKQQQDWQSQNQGQDQGYAQNGQYQGQTQEYSKKVCRYRYIS